MLPRLTTALLAATALLCSCESAGGDPWEDSPDIRGRYHVIVEGTQGCEGRSEYLTAWAPGALTVGGDEPLSLTYDFGDDVVLTGSVNSSYTFSLGGYVETEDWALGVGASGVARTQDLMWVLEGTFSGDAEDEGITLCTISGPFVATQVAP